MCAREGGIRGLWGAFLRDKELLFYFGVTRLCVFMTLLSDHRGRGHVMQRESENICRSKKEVVKAVFMECLRYVFH